MIRPAYLVEGHLEQIFVQNACPGCPVRRINCNGDDVSIGAIAQRVGSLGRLLQKKHSPLIVLFDRENRTESVAEIEAQFRDALRPEGIVVEIVVGIPDRDIESWILADNVQFRKNAGATSSTSLDSCEGKRGKPIIKRVLGRTRSYVETIDGVAWLKSSRAVEMRRNSPSFRSFAGALDMLNCWWLTQ